MKKKNDKTLLAFTVLTPANYSHDVAEVIRTLTQTEPAIISKPQLKLDKVVVYLSPHTDIAFIKASLNDMFPSSYTMREKIIHEHDWRNKWKEHFHPFKLTKRIKVIPSWHIAKKHPRSIEVILDPGYAFGTGLHETTQFMARMIECKHRRCNSLFDVGFGSGILPIVAAKLDYKRIFAIDNDENALSAATINAKKNFVHDIITFKNACLSSFRSSKKYDFVAANLNTTTLLNMSTKLIHFMHDHGYMCISGITLENRKVVHTHYKKQGLRCIKKYIGNEWCGFLYKKKKKRSTRLKMINTKRKNQRNRGKN